MRIKYLLILLVAFELSAGELKSPQARRIAEQMSQVIGQKVQEITALEKAMGVENVQIHLSQGQQFNSGRFGTLLSASSPGLVVSVTPNSQASRLGIESGDQIISVNGVDITEAANSQLALSVLQYAQDNTAVKIVIKREGKSITLSGMLTANLTPSWTFDTQEITEAYQPNNGLSVQAEARQPAPECGQIKLRYRIEGGQKTRSLKTVVVIEAIDGVNVENPLEQDYLKLSAGYHKLKVYRRVHHVNDNREESAEYLIRIDPNMTYYMAYRSDTMMSSAYSQKYAALPVIWKVKEQACQM